MSMRRVGTRLVQHFPHMKKIILLWAWLAAVLAMQAAPDLSATIPELKLNDGRVLRDVSIKAYNSRGVMARCADGIIQIEYSLFPAEYQPALAEKKPAPTTSQPVVTASPGQKQLPANPAQTTANAPAASKQTVQGRVIVNEGRLQAALIGVEVRAYPVREFADWDQNRRRNFSPEHLQIRERLKGNGGGGSASPEETEKFNADEYSSWDSLPYTAFTTKTDRTGSFAFELPASPYPYLIFSRTIRNSGQGHNAYYVWAILATGGPVMLSSDNRYPALADVFAK